jgi:hypothetical protein
MEISAPEMASATLPEDTRELCWPCNVGPSVDVSEQQVLGLWGTAGLCFPVLCAKSSSLMVSFFIKNTSVNYRLKSLNILFY